MNVYYYYQCCGCDYKVYDQQVYYVGVICIGVMCEDGYCVEGCGGYGDQQYVEEFVGGVCCEGGIGGLFYEVWCFCLGLLFVGVGCYCSVVVL